MKYNVDDLVTNRMVRYRWNTSGVGSQYLRIFKYDRKVFFKNLWDQDKRLLTARGIVTNLADDVVMYPFDKIFNLGENGTGLDINPREVFRVVEKKNGFLAQARSIDGELCVTSSGSFSGPYRDMAFATITDAITASGATLNPDYTYMFEICHPDDPHIVYEEPGAYLIGMRNMEAAPNKLLSEHILDLEARSLGFKRPDHFVTTMQQIIKLRAESKTEGFVVRRLSDEEPLFKVKTYHYLCKKAMMRIGDASLDAMYSDTESFKEQRLEEEFYSVCDWIVNTFKKEEWKEFSEQDRRKKLEEYFAEHF